MIVFFPIKENSQRVPGKNFRIFKEKPLWEYVVDKIAETYQVVIDTDSTKVHDACFIKPNVRAFYRKPELCGDTVSVVDLLSNYIENDNTSDVIVQAHVTSPFLDIKHIQIAYRELVTMGYDSVFTVSEIMARLWREESYGLCPVNHNPMKLEQTQDLPPILLENSYFYMFRPEVITKYGNRIGRNPYAMKIGFPYSFDIDTEEDWRNLQQWQATI